MRTTTRTTLAGALAAVLAAVLAQPVAGQLRNDRTAGRDPGGWAYYRLAFTVEDERPVRCAGCGERRRDP